MTKRGKKRKERKLILLKVLMFVSSSSCYIHISFISQLNTTSNLHFLPGCWSVVLFWLSSLFFYFSWARDCSCPVVLPFPLFVAAFFVCLTVAFLGSPLYLLLSPCWSMLVIKLFLLFDLTVLYFNQFGIQ